MPSAVAKRIKLATRYLPTNDPYQAALYYRLAADPRFVNDEQYMEAVAQAGGFINAQKHARFFMGLGRKSTAQELDSAINIWSELKPRARSFLMAMGVRDPEEIKASRERGDGGSLLGDVLGVVSWPFRTAARGAVETGSRALELSARPMQAVQWAYRVGSIATARTGDPSKFLIPGMQQMGVPEERDKMGSLSTLWHDFKYALDVAGEGGGEKAVSWTTRERALELLDGDKRLYDAALDALVHEDLNFTAYNLALRDLQRAQMSPDTNPEEWQIAYQRALKTVRSKKFNNAYVLLQSRQVSFGRDFARSLGVNKTNVVDGGNPWEDAVFDVVSGAMDATFSIVLDPTLMAGRAIKAVRVGAGIARGTSTAAQVAEGATRVQAARAAFRAGMARTRAEEAAARYADNMADTLRHDGVWGEAFARAEKTDIVRLADDPAYREAAHAEWRSLGMNDHELWATEHVLAARTNTEAGWTAFGKLHGNQLKFNEVFRRTHDRVLRSRFNGPVPFVDDQLDDATREILANPLEASAPDYARALEMRETLQRAAVDAARSYRDDDGLASISNFFNFVAEREGAEAILKGYTSRATSPATMFPAITERARVWHASKMKFEDVLDNWRALGGPDAYLDTAITSRFARRTKFHAQHTIRLVTQQLPSQKVFNIMGDDAAVQLNRFLRLALPFSEARQVYGKFLAEANTAGRRNIIETAVDDVLRAYGLEGTDFYRAWKQKIGERSQVYAANKDVGTMVLPNGTTVPAAVWESQLAENLMAMPNLREMMRALPKINTQKHVMGAINSQRMDVALNRVWKPLVILRLGFIPRAAGEESLAALAREPLRMLKAWTLYPIHTPGLYDGDVATPFRLLARLERRIRHFDYFDGYREVYRVRRALAEGKFAELDEQDLAFLWQRVGLRRRPDLVNGVRVAAPGVVEQSEARLVNEFMPWFGRAYKAPRRLKIRLGKNGRSVGFERTPFFMFDPEDVRWTLRLQKMAQNMTRGLLNDADRLALQSVVDHPAVHQAFARGIMGSDTFLWENAAEYRGLRGEVEIGHSPVPGVEPVPMIVDRTTVTASKRPDLADDPTLWWSLSSMLQQSANDPAISNAVGVLLSYIDDGFGRQLDAVLGPNGTKAVRDAVARIRTYDRELLDDFDDLLKIRAGYKNRGMAGGGVDVLPEQQAVDAMDDALRATIREKINLRRGRQADPQARTDVEKLRDMDSIERLLDVWDVLNAEQRGALLWSPDRVLGRYVDKTPLRSGIVGPGDAAYTRKTDLMNTLTDPLVAEADRLAALDDLLEIVVREDLLNEPLSMYQRMAGANGVPIVEPVAEGATRIWFPVLSPEDADAAAARLSRSTDPFDKQLHAAYLRRINSPNPANNAPVVPFGYWGHADPREAARVAAILADNGAYTVGYVDVAAPKASSAYRMADDPVNSYPTMWGDEFIPGKMRFADNPHELAPVGPAERAFARGKSYNPDSDSFVNVFPVENPRAAMVDVADGVIIDNAAEDFDDLARNIMARLGDPRPRSQIVMLHRSPGRRNRQLLPSTRAQIDDVHRRGGQFVITDVAGADDAFVRYLDDIDASYTVYHKGEQPRILLRERQPAQPSAPDAIPEYGVGATFNEVIDEFVAKRVRAVKERFIDPDSGRPLYGVGRGVAAGRWDDALMHQQEVALPWDIIGPARRPYVSNKFDDFVRWGFDSVISPAIDTIIRRPMYLATVAKTYDEVLRTVGPRLLPKRDQIVAVMARFTTPEGAPLFDNVDEFYTAVAPLLRWARDNGMTLRSTADLEKLIQRKAAEVYTSGLDDLPENARKFLYDQMAKQGQTPDMAQHPLDQFRNANFRTGIAVEPQGAGLEAAKAAGVLADEIDIIDADVATLWKWFLSEDDARDTMARIAHGRSFEDNIRYIDDHNIKSQYAETIRNLVPFYFAEEQFYKRWIRTIMYDPAAIRRVQLLQHGLESIGFIKEDPQTGENYFHYPFSAEVNGLLTRVSKWIFGKDAVLPIHVPMTGQVRYAMPGLDGRGLPQVGPLVAVPLTQLAHRFPELQGLEYSVLGERAAGRSLTEQLIPTSLKRFVDAYTASPETSKEMASTMISVIQIMEAEGLTPDDSASEDEVEQYLDRVENWTRSLMFTRAILGFAAPAPPSPEVEGKELNFEFRELLRELPIGDAVATFLKANPDATPFTVFRTKSASGAVLPFGKKSLDWFEKNDDLLKDYPMALPWTIPQEFADEEFAAQAYNQQLALGIRERRMPKEMYYEIKFAKSAPTYFDTKDSFDTLIQRERNLGNSQAARILTEEYGRWRTAFLAQNPVFARELQSPDAKIRRREILTQMSDLLLDPRMKRRIDPATREMMEEFEIYEARVSMLQYDRSGAATQQRAALKKNLFNWLESFTLKNRSARALYLRVIRPELNITDDSSTGIS